MSQNFFGGFRWREVLLTEAVEDVLQAEQLLRAKEIPIKRKAVSRNFYGANQRKTPLGTIGENLFLETQYHLFVPKREKDIADHILNQWRQLIGAGRRKKP